MAETSSSTHQGCTTTTTTVISITHCLAEWCVCYSQGTYLNIKFPCKFVGESRDGTIIQGGLKIQGGKNDGEIDIGSPTTTTSLHDFTIQNSKEIGLLGDINCRNMYVSNIVIEHCQKYGVS